MTDDIDECRKIVQARNYHCEHLLNQAGFFKAIVLVIIIIIIIIIIITGRFQSHQLSVEERKHVGLKRVVSVDAT